MSVTATSQRYESVTEQPGQGASQLQLKMMATRYTWARELAAGRDVLEVACGPGMGLGLLAGVARSVHAGDVNPANLRAATRAYASDPSIRIGYADAMALPYPDEAFDLVLLFEAIYYLRDPGRFLREAQRVLRPGGKLLLATVNREWEGFNASPFSVAYYSASELMEMLAHAGFRVRLYGGFPEETTLASSTIGFIRKAAVALHLVPRTMSGKTFLKRVFYGKLQPIPSRLELRGLDTVAMTALGPSTETCRFRTIYAEASA